MGTRFFEGPLGQHRGVARLFDLANGIDFDKFKPAVEDKRRQAYYFNIWDSGYQMQDDLKRGN